MIYTFTIKEIKPTAREKLIKGDMEVYDVTRKDLVDWARQRCSHYKWMGNSLVFSYGGRNKILIYNTNT